MNFKKGVKGEIINKDKFSFQSENFIKEPLLFVIFGGAGDLSKRKLIPALYRLYYNDRIDCKFKIIGTGIPELNNNRYRNLINESIKSFDDDIYDKKIKTKEFDPYHMMITYETAIKPAHAKIIKEHFARMLEEVKELNRRGCFYLANPYLIVSTFIPEKFLVKFE